MKYLAQDISLRLEVNRCIGCGMCKIVCPHGVFVVEGKKARILDRESCIECGACARNCPVEAIAVASGVGCAEAIINGLLTGKETCGASGECCSSSNPILSEKKEKGGDTKMETKVKDQKQKKGFLATLWESMTKTGGCCGSDKSCCGSSQPGNDQQKTKNKGVLKDEQ